MPTILDVEHRATLNSSLIWNGLENNEFRLSFQPILSFARRTVHGVEALMRWEPPGLGSVPPAVFLDAAQEVDAMAVLGEFAVSEACRCVAEVNGSRPAGGPLRVSVNVSEAELLDIDFRGVVQNSLASSGLAPAQLCLEVRESAFEVDGRGLAPLLEELAEMGVRISVDGLGTGGACLDYLARVPLDEAKIGRSITAGMVSDKRVAALVGGLIRMLHDLGVAVVVEGIEEAQEAAVARSLGADYGQGFFFAAPVEAPYLSRLLTRP